MLLEVDRVDSVDGSSFSINYERRSDLDIKSFISNDINNNKD